jgi:orotidine-5'-phosphate decarboxylase
MVEKFFLALDYETDDDVYKKGSAAIDFLGSEFGKDFVEQRIGVKLNVDALTGSIDPRYKVFRNIFGDLKISHGADTGKRLIAKIVEHEKIPLSYVTVSANFGPEILREYVETGRNYGVNIIAFTLHTKIGPKDVERMYNRSLADEIYVLGQIASEAGCDAMVCEGAMLKDERIRNLPIKILVTGIRLDPADVGTQKRVTAVEDLAKLKPYVDYAVISSKNVSNLGSLKEVLYTLT